MRLNWLYRRTLFALVALVVIVAGSWLWFRRELSRPHAHAMAGQIITIEPHASTAAIVEQLHRAGVLAHEMPLLIWLRVFERDRLLKAGDYEFQSPISARDAIGKLLRGDVATRQFTIPEGFNQFDIMRVLAALPGLKQPPPAKPEDLVTLLRNTILVADLDPAAATLEGYLFPDTYDYTASATREQLIELMVKRFRKVFTPEMRNRAAESGMTLREVVTLASLIEKEAKVDSERELISSVFHRRLKLGMALDCDPTLIYAALIEGRYRGKIYQSDLDHDSPYNTYKHTGLPPGPIASPGRRSLEAALHPADTSYLFFVVDASRNDGSHKFSASASDHEKAVAALRLLERTQDGR